MQLLNISESTLGCPDYSYSEWLELLPKPLVHNDVGVTFIAPEAEEVIDYVEPEKVVDPDYDPLDSESTADEAKIVRRAAEEAIVETDPTIEEAEQALLNEIAEVNQKTDSFFAKLRFRQRNNERSELLIPSGLSKSNYFDGIILFGFDTKLYG